MHVANKGTEDEWSCECCDPNGYHHHVDETCEHVCCPAWEGIDSNPPHDDGTCDFIGIDWNTDGPAIRYESQPEAHTEDGRAS